MPTITAKIQIHVSDNQAESLKITTNAYRKACNWLSKHIFETKNLNQVNLNNLYYSDLRNQFRLKSQMAQSVMKTVIARYKSAKSNGHEWSLIDFKLAEYDLVWNRDYSLTKNQFSVNTLEGRLKLNYERKAMKKYFNSTWKFGTAKLVHKYKKWFLHIPMTKEYQTLDFADVNNIVGVDLGINFLATTYDSQSKTTFYNGNIVKHKRGKFKATRKQLQTRQTPSSRKKIKQIGS
ncbi:transposase, partial [Bacillus pacificus]